MAIEMRRRSGARLALLVLTAVSLAIGASPAAAQTAQATGIASVATPGRDLIVVFDDGREVKGRVRTFSPDAIQFVVKDKTVDVPVASIWGLEETFRDPIGDGVKRGALTGLIAGAIFGVVMSIGGCGDNGFVDLCNAEGFLFVTGVMGGYGAGIGAASGAIGDSLNHRRREVWRRAGASSAIAVTPFGNMNGGGVRVSLRW